ncbi:MAG: sensor domain-containing diguanylate cyclase [Gammaproteobacteria bacterium]|jgi:diguanylate cyclase (GGDEF)-like protein
MDKYSTTPTENFDERLQQRLEAVLDGMPVAVSWAGLKDQKIQFVNSKFRELFGYELGDHSTVTDWIQQTYPDPAQVERAMAMWGPHFETSAIVPFEIDQVEVDVKCKDGSVKTTLLGGVILPSEGWALAIFTDITNRKHAERRTEQLALEDPLTGLANRRAFDRLLRQSLAHAFRHRHSVALLIADLDDLKAVNDTLGHASGDAVLQTVADRLRLGVREEDSVCRLGGDEFAVILKNVADMESVEHIAERILEEVDRPFTLEGKAVPLALSIGIGLFPADAGDEKQLYKIADEALYRAKEGGRGRWSH